MSRRSSGLSFRRARMQAAAASNCASLIFIFSDSDFTPFILVFMMSSFSFRRHVATSVRSQLDLRDPNHGERRGGILPPS